MAVERRGLVRPGVLVQPGQQEARLELAADLRLNGDLWQLPAGTVASAFGLEVRQEKLSDQPDLMAQSRFERNYLVDVIGFGSSKSAAERKQWALFSELLVPLVDKVDLQKTYVLRRILNPMGTTDAIEFLISKLKQTKTNSEFFESMNT